MSTATPKRPPIPGKNLSEQRAWLTAQVKPALARKLKQSTRDYYAKRFALVNSRRELGESVPDGAFGRADELPDGTIEYVVNPDTASTSRAAFAHHTAMLVARWLRVRRQMDGEMRKALDAGETAKADEFKKERDKAWAYAKLGGQDLMDHPIKAARGRAKEAHTRSEEKKEYAVKMVVYKATKALGLSDKADKPVKPAPLALGQIAKAVAEKRVKLSTDESKSKRKTATQLAKKVPQWREFSFIHAPKKWKTFTAVASLFGPRPCEIAGATLSLDPVNPGYIRAVFKGAKYNPEANIGLEYRTVSVRLEDSTAFQHLLDLVKDGPYIVPVPTFKNGRALTTVEKTFGTNMNHTGRKFLSKLRTELLLSPYCFRHAFCADMKASGVSPVDIAAAMGHTTTEMQRLYGRASGGTSRLGGVIIDASMHNIKHEPTVNFFAARAQALALAKAQAEAQTLVVPEFNNPDLEHDMGAKVDQSSQVDPTDMLPFPNWGPFKLQM